MSLVAANETLGFRSGLTETVAGLGRAERGPPCLHALGRTIDFFFFFGSHDSGERSLEIWSWRIRWLASLEHPEAPSPSQWTECQLGIPTVLASLVSGPLETERKGRLFFTLHVLSRLFAPGEYDKKKHAHSS